MLQQRTANVRLSNLHSNVYVVPNESLLFPLPTLPSTGQRRDFANHLRRSSTSIGDDDLKMQTEKLVGTKSSYKVGHEILEEHTKYTVIAAVKGPFRGKEYIFAIMSNGLKVRCGRSLETKIAEWLDDHDDGEAPHMKFKTITKKRVRGYTDILVE